MTCIVEAEEEESTALIGGPTQELMMECSDEDSRPQKIHDEDPLSVDSPETAHQISKGFIIVFLSLPFSYWLKIVSGS